jgi:PTH1 family peptidyl-tRNA hydrolase
MNILICLGNHVPGYNFTRHNIGRDFLEWAIAPSLYKENKYFYSYTDETKERLYIIPKTTMNISGTIFCDKELAYAYKNGEISSITILHDDLEVPFGRVKVRANKERGHRGHNGNRSIINTLKSISAANFTLPYFISIGIDRPPEEIPVSQWVLKKYNNQEKEYICNTIFPKIEEAINSLLKN